MGNLNLVSKVTRNAGLNASPYQFAAAGAAQPVSIQPDIDISMPLRGIHLFIFGQLATAAGGGADLAVTTETTLKMIQFIQLDLLTDSGTKPIIPAGTRFYEFMTNMRAYQRNDLFGEGRQVTANAGTADSWQYLAATLAASPENFVIPLYIPFSTPGAMPGDRERTCILANRGTRGIRLTLTPFTNAGAAGSVAIDYPFPTSTRAFTFNGFGAVGAFQCLVYPDQIANYTPNDPNIGTHYPVFESQRLVTAPGAGAVQRLNNWQREGLFRGIFFSQEAVTLATGATASAMTNLAYANFRARDFILQSNSTEIMQHNLLHMAVAANGTNINDVGALSPIFIDYMRGGTLAGLRDFTPMVQANALLNMEFQNVAAPGAGVNDLYNVMTVRYLPR